MNVTVERLTLLVTSLETCLQALERLEETCCMPDRSPHMQYVRALLIQTRELVQRLTMESMATQQCLQNITDIGAKLGFLYATCCTPEREAHYQTIFRELGAAHMNMLRVLGSGH